MANLFLGIEAVGMSFSVAALADSTGKILSAARGEPFSLHANSPASLREGLILLINSLARNSAKYTDWSRIVLCIGLTGATFPYDVIVSIPDELARLGIAIPPKNLICTGDAEIITAANTQASKAAAIISHMGSTAYFYNNGKNFRCGGWGPQLGDEGSAFAFGHSAVRRILYEYDCRKEASVLWKCVQDWLTEPKPQRDCWTKGSYKWRQCVTRCLEYGQDLRTTLFTLAHALGQENMEHWRCLIAGLAIPVMNAWEQGDSSARSIVEDGAQKLATQLGTLLQNYTTAENSLPVVMYGGLMRHHARYRQLVANCLSEGIGMERQLTILSPQHPNAMRPVCGALLFAIGGSSHNNLILPPAEIVETMRSSVRSSPFAKELTNE